MACDREPLVIKEGIPMTGSLRKYIEAMTDIATKTTQPKSLTIEEAVKKALGPKPVQGRCRTSWGRRVIHWLTRRR